MALSEEIINLNEEKRQLSIQNRFLMTEAEKYSRLILTLEKVGLFVFKVLDEQHKGLDFSLIEGDFDIYENHIYATEIENVTRDLIQRFNARNVLMNPQKLLDESERMAKALFNLEEDILRCIEVDERIIKEKQSRSNDYRSVLKDLAVKEAVLKEQLHKLKVVEQVS